MCYVEPTRDMGLKRDHEFVSPDGSCDTSFWNPSMKLVHLVQEAQRRFAINPPVYARASGDSGRGGTGGMSKSELIAVVTSRAQTKLQTLFRQTGAELDRELTLQAKLSAVSISAYLPGSCVTVP